MAEFNLPGNSFLTINREEYSKDDILKIIEDLRELSFTSLHQTIFGHPETLRFFEDPKAPVQLTEVMTFLDGMITHADNGKLQELLLEAMQENTKYTLSVHDYKVHRENSILANYLEKYQEIRLYETIRKQLFSLIYSLSSYHEKRIKAADVEGKLSGDFGFLWTGDFIEFMNELPEEFYEVEQAINESLLYFVIYCYNHYRLPSAFYYQLIDSLLELESLDRYTRNQLYEYRHKITFEETEARRQVREIVREPDNDHIYIAPADKTEMTEERKAKLQKRLNRELLEVRVVKTIAVLTGICVVLGGIFFPVTKISVGFFLTASGLFFVLVLFWVKTFFKK